MTNLAGQPLGAKCAMRAIDTGVHRCENAMMNVSGILSGLRSEQAAFDGIVGLVLRLKVVPAMGLFGSLFAAAGNCPPPAN
jgi:hypothetical protein